MKNPPVKDLVQRKAPMAWERISRSLVQKTIVFDLYVDRLRSPRNGAIDDFYLIDVVDWVNVIALTDSNEVLFVEQYRFGVEQNSLELPGGMVSTREEDPLLAMHRELEEETGYHAEEMEYLGFVHPNPAIQTNKCHFYFAPKVVRSGNFKQDELEDIAVHRIPVTSVLEMIREGKITHALMVTAFMRLIAVRGIQVLEAR